MEIAKMLTISTAHVTQKTANKIDREEITGLVIYSKDEFGWFIFIPEDLYEEDYDELPKDLKACIQLAMDNDCNWLCLDCDGEELDELEVYEW